jgi:hypothetical protein
LPQTLGHQLAARQPASSADSSFSFCFYELSSCLPIPLAKGFGQEKD